MTAPGVAATETPDSQSGAFGGAMYPYRFISVGGAGGQKSTGTAKNHRKTVAINPDQATQKTSNSVP